MKSVVSMFFAMLLILGVCILGILYFLSPDKTMSNFLPSSPKKTFFHEKFDGSEDTGWTGLRKESDGNKYLALIPAIENKYFGLNAFFDNKKKMLSYKNGFVLSFRYYLGVPTKLYVSFLNATKNDNYHFSPSGLEIKKWSEIKIPLRNFMDNEFKGKPLTKGDSIERLNFYAASPGETPDVYIDDIKIAESAEVSPAPAEPQALDYVEQFESGLKSWQGNLDASAPAQPQGASLRAIPLNNQYFGVGASYHSDTAIIKAGKDSSMEFSYYLNEPSTIYVSLFNRTKNDNFHFEIKNAKSKQWETARRTFKQFVDNNFSGKTIGEGDEITDINIFAGAPKSDVGLWIDNLKLQSKQSMAEINNFSEPVKRNWARYQKLTRAITDNLRKYYKDSNKPQSIMNLGDSISKSMAFMWPARYSLPGMLTNEGYNYIDKDSAAADNQTSQWGRSIVDKALKDNRPETVTILFGTNDARFNVYTGTFFANMEYIVDACLKNGSVPILLTIPPFLGVELKKIEDYNYIIKTIAQEKQVPCCDIYALFTAQKDWNSLLSDGIHPNHFEDGNKGGYNYINDVLCEFYKILENDVMRRNNIQQVWLADNFNDVSPDKSEILFFYDFEDGNQGWNTDQANISGADNSSSCLKLLTKNNELNAKCDITFKVTPSTYIELYCYAENCSSFRVQMFNHTQQDNFWASKQNVPQKQWVRYVFDVNRDFQDNEMNQKEIYFGDIINAFNVYGQKINLDSKLYIDNVRIYNATPESYTASLKQTLEGINKEYGQLIKTVNQPDTLVKEIQSLYEDVTSSMEKAGTDNIAVLKDKLNRIETLARKLIIAMGMKAAFNLDNPPLGVGYENSMVRISPFHQEYLFKGTVKNNINIFSAQNEVESFQFYLVPMAGVLKNVNIKFNNLTHENGTDSFSAENFSWFIEGFVTTKLSFPVPKYILGKKPDPLLPGKPFDLDNEQPIWINAKTPIGQKPGKYKGVLQIQWDGCDKPISIEINLKVWDFQIPVSGRLLTPTTLDFYYAFKDYYKQSVTPEKRRQWYKFCLDHRIDPTDLYHYGLSPIEEDLDYCVNLGLRTIMIGGNHDQKQLHDPDWIKKQHKMLSDKNLLDKAMIIVTDKGVNYQDVIEKCKWLKENCPGLKRFAGCGFRKPLFGFIDVWDPVIDTITWDQHDIFDEETTRQRQDLGEIVMWFVAASPWYPYVNMMIDNDLIETRVFFWMTWKYNLDGFEYYYINLWGRNLLGRDEKKQWPEVPWDTYTFFAPNGFNGDGQFIYPGPDMTPYSCVRLENVRDGIEDYETLNMLKEYIEKVKTLVGTDPKAQQIIQKTEKILSVPDNIVKDLVTYTRNPDEIKTIRNNIGELLESYKKAVDAPQKKADGQNKQ